MEFLTDVFMLTCEEKKDEGENFAAQHILI